MAIPGRIIEGIYNSELKAEDFYDKYGKEEIEQALEEIKKSNIEILNKYPAEDMKKAIEAKMKKQAVPSVSTKTKYRSFRIISYAAAAVFVAAIALPAGINTYKSKTEISTERTKGSGPVINQTTKLSLYRQKNKEVELLSNGSKVEEGDVIQITYQAGKENYGIIFSVDGNGNVTRHFPTDSWTASKLRHGKDEIPLDFSYELDDAPNFECFIMVTSKKEFELNDIERKIKDVTNIDYLKSLKYLPNKTEGIFFLLNK